MREHRKSCDRNKNGKKHAFFKKAREAPVLRYTVVGYLVNLALLKIQKL